MHAGGIGQCNAALSQHTQVHVFDTGAGRIDPAEVGCCIEGDPELIGFVPPTHEYLGVADVAVGHAVVVERHRLDIGELIAQRGDPLFSQC